MELVSYLVSCLVIYNFSHALFSMTRSTDRQTHKHFCRASGILAINIVTVVYDESVLLTSDTVKNETQSVSLEDPFHTAKCALSILFVTRQATYIKRNHLVRACNHCCSEKAVSITYPECVFVALSSMSNSCAVLFCHLWPFRFPVLP